MKKCTDHLNKEYDSMMSMCKYYNLTPMTFKHRLQTGWTLEQALTMPVKECSKKLNKDHLGNKYESTKAMCDFYNVPEKIFRGRLHAGMSLAKALTTPYEKKVIRDHNGKAYASVAEMCKAYGINPESYRARINNGRNMEKALTEPVNKGYQCLDHLGNRYPSIKSMVDAYNIDRSVFDHRINAGWTLEKALTYDINKKRVGETNIMHNGEKCTITDYNGCRDISVEFEDGFVVKHVNYACFKKGKITKSY